MRRTWYRSEKVLDMMLRERNEVFKKQIGY